MMQDKKILFKRFYLIFFLVSLLFNGFFLVSTLAHREIREHLDPIHTINKIWTRIFPRGTGNMPGKWGELRSRPGQKDLNPGQKEEMRKLESLGYLSGYKKAPQKKNITIYNKELTYKGLNLLCSGHGPEAILMDMEGNPLHKWKCDVFSVWPGYKPPYGSRNHEVWRRVHLLENGDLLAIFEGIGIIKIDKDSNIIWANPNKAHHDLFVSKDRRIYVLTREAKINPRYDETKPILEDFIEILEPTGRQIKRISILKCIENSEYMPLLNRSIKDDFLHTNTIELVDYRLASKLKEVREGNVLVCIPRLDMVGVIDLEKEQVVWAVFNLWKAQHQSTVLGSGNILIFDNTGASDQSRVLEFDPLTQQIYWKYMGTPQEPFYSKTCGSCQKLPNGNVLVSETEGGRAFEVTPDKKIVWEFLSPFRAGEKKELIAAVYEVVRLETDFHPDWLQLPALQ